MTYSIDYKMAGLLGNLIGDATGDATGLLDFMSHPMESLLLFTGGIILLVIVYKIIVS
jgi:hypothetical protein